MFYTQITVFAIHDLPYGLLASIAIGLLDLAGVSADAW